MQYYQGGSSTSLVLQTFQNGLENWRRESCSTRTMLLGTSLWLQSLLCVTVVLNWMITLHILLIWHHLTIFCSQHDKHFGWEAVSDGWCDHNSWGLLRWSGWEVLYHGNPSAATTMEGVCGPQGRLCWKINPILDKFDHCMTVCLWTFQPTLVDEQAGYIYMYVSSFHIIITCSINSIISLCIWYDI